MGYFTLKDETHEGILAETRKLAEDARIERDAHREAWPEFDHIDTLTDVVVKVVRDEQYGVTADYVMRKLARVWSSEEVGAGLAMALHLGRVATESEHPEDREKRLALAKGIQEEPEELAVWYVPKH